MWRFVLMSVFVVVIADDSDYSEMVVANGEAVAFRKCCQTNETLLKLTDDSLNVYYQCIDSANEFSTDVEHFPLLVGSGYVTINGFPENCSMSDLIETESMLTSENQCNDRLTDEIYNGTKISIIPKTIGLACDTMYSPLNSSGHILYIRKCCPKGKTYDVKNHMCRENKEGKSIKSLVKSLFDSDKYICEVDHDLYCKPDQYMIELTDYSFTLDGSSLTIRRGRNETTLYRGDWCVEHDHSSEKIVARVCTQKCSDFDAICFYKCCPVDQHYVPRRPNSTVSSCVPNSDYKHPLNLSYYLQPLKNENPKFPELIGVSAGLRCPLGKFVSNRNTDYLTESGLYVKGIGESGFTNNFCFETFDNRTWGGEVTVEIMACFEPNPSTKNFVVSFITITISWVFLLMTLVVYLSLSELRNLHGKTLICHVSVMLLAYGCLARVQYKFVENHRICTVLGYCIYFGFVAAFSWLNVMCFDIWWTFGSMRTMQPFQKAHAERRRFAWYSVYAWGLSVTLTGSMLLLDMYPVAEFLDANIGLEICWFGSIQNTDTDWPHYIFFVIPMGVITCTNLVLWVLTARHCARVKSEVHRMQAGSVGDRVKKRFQADRAKYLLTVRLWVVMGAGWVWEVLSTVVSQPAWLWMGVDIINELQGVFIFIILVLKPKVFFLIKKRLGCTRRPNDTSLEKTQKNGATSGRTSSTFLSRTISSDERTNLRTSIPANKIK